jgi:hypothetical protein
MNARNASHARLARSLALLLLAASPVRAVGVAERQEAPKLGGISLPERIEVEAHTLVLNGAALRKIALIKIYVAGLYLPDRQNNADAILAADGSRTLMMHFLRDVDASRLCEGWDSSLERNTPSPSAGLRDQFVTLCSWMEDAGEGERLVFRYAPGEGTSVEIKGKVKGPVGGKEFADALFRTWLGPKAIPGEEFKKHLLGY